MIPARYINLDRVPERAAHMAAELARAGLSHAVRHPASDARLAPPAPGYAPRNWGQYWTLKPSEVACFESHRAAWRTLLATGVPAFAVFEDDILAAPDLGAAVERLAAEADRFDLVKLDGVPGRTRLGPALSIGGETVRPIRQVLSSAAAYLLSRRGAETLLARSERYCDRLDDFVTRPRAGWRAFQLVPARAVQAAFAGRAAAIRLPATIAESEREADAATNAGYDRGPAAYRLAKEARRSGRRIARALWTDRALTASGGAIGEVPLAPGLGPYRAG